MVLRWHPNVNAEFIDPTTIMVYHHIPLPRLAKRVNIE